MPDAGSNAKGALAIRPDGDGGNGGTGTGTGPGIGSGAGTGSGTGGPIGPTQPPWIRPMLQPGESVLTIRGPSLWYAVLRRFWVHAICIVVMASAWRLAALGILPFSPGFSAALASTVLSISLLMGVATCAAEHYILTDRRLFVIKGVLARKSVQIPLTSAQEVRTNATLAQRLLGIGDVQASTAAPTVGCLMRCIRRPLQWADLLQASRMAALRQQGTASSTL